MKKSILVFLLAIVWANANAKYRQVCLAQYETEYGWSKQYQVEVTFMTGNELNIATGRYSYTPYSVYAIIFWGEGQATVIKMSNYFACGLETNKTCIQSAWGYLKGLDQDGDAWRICKDSYCF